MISVRPMQAQFAMGSAALRKLNLDVNKVKQPERT
jgi:hypothetical protein